MPSMFDELVVGGMRLKNRIAMSPMLMYMSDEEGTFTDDHFVHYGSRILGGVGLVTTEVLAVEPQGRISTRDMGLWSDRQIEGLRRLVEFAHRHETAACAQLAHAGRKSTSQGDVVAPSPIAYGDFPVPQELSTDAIAAIVRRYADAAARAVTAGFDAIELHMCHGYLFHQFLSSAANRRTDGYGGSLENRMRFPLEAVRAIRATIPAETALIARISGHDFADDGIIIEETIPFGGELYTAGVDMLVVTTGNIVPGYAGTVFPGYQTPYAARVKAELEGLVGTVGSLASGELADYIVRTEDADVVYLGRALLDDPFWYLHAAKKAGVETTLPIPTYSRATGPYERGF